MEIFVVSKAGASEEAAFGAGNCLGKSQIETLLLSPTKGPCGWEELLSSSSVMETNCTSETKESEG
jgi:hypothetical protein